ncbi:TniQ family protein [Salimicrobium flavidum]|uniref:TniQ protein n=1 Tax=Salimicrobium flavidum TaxID=570947 RepID=A0A1N7J2L3_9BACI|nr:TniQ family protein [Salimicrobium flavidum]SIS43477.1 TniQ protein [Salimicrobium flavidum]
MIITTERIDSVSAEYSTLYNLQPVGLGTPYIESLTSYITRLSKEHNVSLGNLVKGVIGPAFEQSYIKKNLAESVFGETGRYINGNSDVSIYYIKVMEILTGREDIQHLTMCNWKGVFHKNIIGKNKKWCEFCLEEWKKNDQVIYEPLIWQVDNVNFCDNHNCELSSICFNCNKSQGYLSSMNNLGYCQFCFSWLGVKRSTSESVETPHEEEFINQNFKELILESQNKHSFPTQNNILNSFNCLKDEYGGINKLSVILNVKYHTLVSWVLGYNRPSVENLEIVCSSLNISMLDFFDLDEKTVIDNRVSLPNSFIFGNDEESRKELQRNLEIKLNDDTVQPLSSIAKELQVSTNYLKSKFPGVTKKLLNKHREHQSRIWQNRSNEIIQLLNEEINSPQPISKAEFCRVNEFSLSSLNRHFPLLARELVEKHKEYTAFKKKKRKEEIKKEVKDIMITIHNRGEYPSIRNIIKSMNKKGVFRNPEIRSYYKAQMKELGYVVNKNRK